MRLLEIYIFVKTHTLSFCMQHFRLIYEVKVLFVQNLWYHYYHTTF